ncbi:hypothetical protein PENTCL1PPCAC_5635, partial [Pristionchus entomophagus]
SKFNLSLRIFQMGEELVAYIGTAEQRYGGGKLTAWAVVFPSRPSLNYCRRVRNTGRDETHFAQLCALLKILWQVDQMNEDAGRREIEKVIVKTNARRFVTSVQMELARVSSLGYVGERRHKAAIMEIIKSYRQFVALDMYFAPTSDAHVDEVNSLAKEVL